MYFKGFFQKFVLFLWTARATNSQVATPMEWRAAKRKEGAAACRRRRSLLKQQRRRHSLLHGAQWFIFKTNVKILFKDENGQIGLI